MSQPTTYQTTPQYYPPAPPPHQPQMTVITVQPTACPPTGHVHLDSDPCYMVCPHCHTQIHTRTCKESGLCTWLGVAGCLIFGCWLGCCLIPLCMDAGKDTIHSCPHCNIQIGKHKVI